MSEPRARSFGVASMVGVALLAFGFAFALVPLYRIACEKVFGVRLEKGPQAAVQHEAKQARWVTVQFDGGVNSKLPWQFAPEQKSMRVQVGRQYEALYFARNTSDRGIVGREKRRFPAEFDVARDLRLGEIFGRLARALRQLFDFGDNDCIDGDARLLRRCEKLGLGPQFL